MKARTTTGSLTRRRSRSDSVAPDAEMEDSQSTNENDFSAAPSPRNTEDGDASDRPTAMSPAISTASKKPKKSLNDQLLEIEHQKLQFLKEKEKSRQNRTNADNEHLLFFKSLLPHIDKIP